MKTIDLPQGLVSFENRVFRQCTSLRSMVFPSSLRVIGDGVFESCKSLKTITISSSVIHIGEGMLEGCDGMEDVYLKKDSYADLYFQVNYGKIQRNYL